MQTTILHLWAGWRQVLKVRQFFKNKRKVYYSKGVDDIMLALDIGRYRAREVLAIMDLHNVDMQTAYNIYINGKDIDDL